MMFLPDTLYSSSLRVHIPEQQLVHGKIPPDDILLSNCTKTSKKYGRNSKSRTESSEYQGNENDDDDNNVRSRSSGTCSSGGEGLFDDQQSLSTIRSPLVAKILEANPVCADCGNTDPE